MATLPFFPQLYQNELLYSALARYKVRCGVVSDKLLLADVFDKQTIVASPEMLNGIGQACNNIQPSIACSPKEIVRNHTLFPVYTAFSEMSIKNKIMAQMIGNSANTYTTSTGIATCTLKPFNIFRYCPVCVAEQIDQFGEAFWDRRWFGFYTFCCPVHGSRFAPTKIAIHKPARHSFTPLLEVLSTATIKDKNVISAIKQDYLISTAAMKLMSHQSSIIFTFQHLTQFYKGLAIASNFNRGNQIKQNDVAEFITNFWSWRWLKHLGFNRDGFNYTMSCLFRKHRKQQVYPVHLIAALPFFDGKIESWWNALTTLQEIAQHNSLKTTVIARQISTNEISEWKTTWLTSLRKLGPKAARYQNRDSEKLYTALYRADRNWLLKVNKTHSIQRAARSKRVSWRTRDYNTCKLLFSYLYHADDIHSPRRSKRWYLSKLPSMATIENNLYRLPLTAMFLTVYSESYQDYQCRRLIQVTLDCFAKKVIAQPWQLYRNARINTQRCISSQVTKTCDWCSDWLIAHIE